VQLPGLKYFKNLLFNRFLDWNVACKPEVAKQPIAAAYWSILKLIFRLCTFKRSSLTSIFGSTSLFKKTLT
jgi:hypothetical protein